MYMDIEQKNVSHEKRNLIIALVLIIAILFLGWYFLAYKKSTQLSPEEKDRIIQESGFSSTPMTKKEKDDIINSKNMSNSTLTPEEKDRIINSSQ